MRNIGILTGGGDCPGLNAVIRATYKTLKDSCDCRIIGIRDGYDGLIFDNCEEITPEMARGILAKGGTILGTSNKGNPLQYPVEQADGTIQFVDYSDRIMETYNKYELEGIIIIGGEGSMYIADTLSRKGIKYVGVPKTIDNDIYGTDLTFGFNTAVQLATDAIDRIHTTAESHHRVMIVETMGRDSGFIALYSGIAGGGDVILIPEIPYSMDAIVKKLKERYDIGKKFSIMVVSEGAKPIGGEVFGKENKKNIYDRIKLGGIGMKLADEIEKLTGFETRATVLGYLQRGGTPTSYDRILATRYGCAAARAFLEGKFGNMVALDGNDIVLRNVSENAGRKRLIELDSPLIKDAKSIGICLGI
ncbi:MAG: 6-phosphofructokinase [Firmicutes bacterium]|nr:6-phosphofructokinase [Bacillota bacterium]